jgi:short-subunit dehydrogenase
MTWRLHVMSHVFAAREVLPAMVQRGEGYLLQTASVISLSTQADKVTYSVTKHGALALAEWLAIHYRPKGVRVSCFCPSAMNTRMLRANGFGDDHPIMQIALSPEAVAEIVVEGIDRERFLITTDEGAEDVLHEKANDWDGWIERTGARFV